jgi:Transcription termination factor nusG
MFEPSHGPGFTLPFAESDETVSMSAHGLAWDLIRTKSGKENYVNRNLSRRLSETFMPMLETRSRRRTVSRIPLFPQYLFVRLELAVHYFEIRYMPGVVGFISRVASCSPSSRLSSTTFATAAGTESCRFASGRSDTASTCGSSADRLRLRCDL